ncbi:MAG: phage tail protein I [Zoogloeaceae bacterium]|jgi:phage tail P2-like protein|nr:phage tail protein I [Zoogloeaceae bacterium]
MADVPAISPQGNPVADLLAQDVRFGAFSRLTERLAQIDLKMLFIYLVDAVDAAALPHLAAQFHVVGREGWHSGLPEAMQRTLIRQAIELHRTKGTPWAVKKALAILGFPVRLIEWFEYGGEPYRFKLEVDVSQLGIDEATLARAESLALEFKNARSHLELLTVIVNAACSLRIAAAALSGEAVSVYPFSIIDRAAPPPSLHIGIGCHDWCFVSIYPKS